MMTLREKWARNIALLTGILLVGLAALFAVLQNPADDIFAAKKPDASTALPDVTTSNADIMVAGRAVLDQQGCLRCHAVAGEGNRRNPLDGVGMRRNAKEIRQWILAPVELQDQMSGWAFQSKQAYQNLPAEDIDALVIYLQSLPASPPAH